MFFYVVKPPVFNVKRNNSPSAAAFPLIVYIHVYSSSKGQRHPRVIEQADFHHTAYFLYRLTARYLEGYAIFGQKKVGNRGSLFRLLFVWSKSTEEPTQLPHVQVAIPSKVATPSNQAKVFPLETIDHAEPPPSFRGRSVRSI